MAVKFQKIVRTIVVILASVMVLSGCKETTTVSEKPVVTTEKKTQKKTEKKTEQKKENKEKKKTQKPSKSLEETEEEEEEFIEEEVEEETEEEPSVPDKITSNSTTSKGESKPAGEKQENSAELTCYLSIYCDTILDNMDKLEAGKEVLVPSNGVLYEEREVTFTKGETVFDVLLRETKKNGIHMEYSFTPGFNSNYIEGIANLYEMDCGPNSGWMYSVNGVYPDYGCSVYELKDQDVIEWNYTCDLGRDL